MFGLSSLLHAENGGVHVVVSEWMHVGQAGQGLPLGIYVYGRTGKGARVARSGLNSRLFMNSSLNSSLGVLFEL